MHTATAPSTDSPRTALDLLAAGFAVVQTTRTAGGPGRECYAEPLRVWPTEAEAVLAARAAYEQEVATIRGARGRVAGGELVCDGECLALGVREGGRFVWSRGYHVTPVRVGSVPPRAGG